MCSEVYDVYLESIRYSVTQMSLLLSTHHERHQLKSNQRRVGQNGEGRSSGASDRANTMGFIDGCSTKEK